VWQNTIAAFCQVSALVIVLVTSIAHSLVSILYVVLIVGHLYIYS